MFIGRSKDRRTDFLSIRLACGARVFSNRQSPWKWSFFLEPLWNCMFRLIFRIDCSRSCVLNFHVNFWTWPGVVLGPRSAIFSLPTFNE